MSKSICVFSSSSNAIDAQYFRLAHQLGTELGRRKHTLVFGGGEVGLMGAVASAAQKNGGKIIGVIPEGLRLPGIAFEAADELIVTGELRQRKAEMERRADAFIALPGGFGTLEETLEIITLKQLRYHVKPIILLNCGNFFDPLLALFEYLYTEKFAKPADRQLYHIATTVTSVFEYLENYQPADPGNKWHF